MRSPIFKIAKGLLTGKAAVDSISAKNRKPPTNVPIRRVKRQMSPEGRAAIIAAQKKRWALQKKAA